MNTCAPAYCPVGQTYLGHFLDFYDTNGQPESTCQNTWLNPSDSRWDYIYRRNSYSTNQACNPNDPGWAPPNDWQSMGYMCTSEAVYGEVLVGCQARCI